MTDSINYKRQLKMKNVLTKGQHTLKSFPGFLLSCSSRQVIQDFGISSAHYKYKNSCYCATIGTAIPVPMLAQ